MIYDVCVQSETLENRLPKSMLVLYINQDGPIAGPLERDKSTLAPALPCCQSPATTHKRSYREEYVQGGDTRVVSAVRAERGEWDIG